MTSPGQIFSAELGGAPPADIEPSIMEAVKRCMADPVWIQRFRGVLKAEVKDELKTELRDELKAELLTLVGRLPQRGRLAFEADVMPWEVEAVRTCVDDLEPFDPAARDGWMFSEDFCGDWELRYTSSRAFHRNEGATGYAFSRPGCATPELILRIDAPRLNWITLEEPVVRSGADAAVAGVPPRLARYAR